MKKVRFNELKVGDTFKVEYGCYDNWVDATLTKIENTDYEHIKVITYICNGSQFVDRQLVNEFVAI